MEYKAREDFESSNLYMTELPHDMEEQVCSLTRRCQD